VNCILAADHLVTPDHVHHKLRVPNVAVYGGAAASDEFCGAYADNPVRCNSVMGGR
jgi:hypothetical protein